MANHVKNTGRKIQNTGTLVHQGQCLKSTCAIGVKMQHATQPPYPSGKRQNNATVCAVCLFTTWF